MKNALETIHELRSVHGDFSNRDIPDEDLKTIINTCVRAANASARQSYSIIVVTDRNTVREQFGYAGSCGLLFCVDYNRIRKTASHLGHDFQPDGVVSFITGSTDTIMAAQTAAIAARALGIDSLFTNSVHRCDIRKLKETFGLPEKYCFPLIALVLGYPRTEPEAVKGRLNGPGVIHYGKYREPDRAELEELIAIYDDPSRNMGLIRDWKEKGYAHYLDWFHQAWTRGASPEKEREFYSTLRKAGFLDCTDI